MNFTESIRPQGLWRYMLGLAAFVSTATATTLGAQNASLIGTVLGDSIERPIANADVVLAALSLTTRTDSLGNFRFLQLPAGRHQFLFRAVGFQPVTATLSFTQRQRIEGDFILAVAGSKLDTITVRAKPRTNPRLVEFESHRNNSGRFLTADVFEQAQGRPLADVIRSRVPGIRIAKANGADILATTRGGGRAFGGDPNCYIQVVLNSLIVFRTGQLPLFDMRTLNADDVIGLEYYTVANTPNQYNGTGANCGTVVIWTK